MSDAYIERASLHWGSGGDEFVPAGFTPSPGGTVQARGLGVARPHGGKATGQVPLCGPAGAGKGSEVQLRV